MTIELKRTGQGGSYGKWTRVEDGMIQAAAFEAAACEAIESGNKSGHIECGGQCYTWRIA